MKAKITWWVYDGSERIRRTAKMRGCWDYDATCSCGWDTKTGGTTRSYVEKLVRNHKLFDHGDDPTVRALGPGK